MSNELSGVRQSEVEAFDLDQIIDDAFLAADCLSDHWREGAVAGLIVATGRNAARLSPPYQSHVKAVAHAVVSDLADVLMTIERQNPEDLLKEGMFRALGEEGLRAALGNPALAANPRVLKATYTSAAVEAQLAQPGSTRWVESLDYVIDAFVLTTRALRHLQTTHTDIDKQKLLVERALRHAAAITDADTRIHALDYLQQLAVGESYGPGVLEVLLKEVRLNKGITYTSDVVYLRLARQYAQRAYADKIANPFKRAKALAALSRTAQDESERQALICESSNLIQSNEDPDRNGDRQLAVDFKRRDLVRLAEIAEHHSATRHYFEAAMQQRPYKPEDYRALLLGLSVLPGGNGYRQAYLAACNQAEIPQEIALANLTIQAKDVAAAASIENETLRHQVLTAIVDSAEHPETIKCAIEAISQPIELSRPLLIDKVAKTNDPGIVDRFSSARQIEMLAAMAAEHKNKTALAMLVAKMALTATTGWNREDSYENQTMNNLLCGALEKIAPFLASLTESHRSQLFYLSHISNIYDEAAGYGRSLI